MPSSSRRYGTTATEPGRRALLRWGLFSLLALFLVAGCASVQEETGAGTATPTVRATRLGLARMTSPTVTPSPPLAVSPSRAAGSTPRSAAATSTRPPRPSATASPSPTYAIHVVQEEETLIEIALRYGVGLLALTSLNGLENPNLLQTGQQLRIPPSAGTPTPAASGRDYGYAIVGYSVEGRAIEDFSFGDGPNHVVFVGGIHGGYEWNTVLLAYQMIDYFNGYRDEVPPSVTLHIIPVANPDGLYLVTGSAGRFSAEQVPPDSQAGRRDGRGRFNGRGVDLNRNWDCDWSPSARWGATPVDPGSGPFSEPESRALRDYFQALQPRSVIFWHSAAELVSAGSCGADLPAAVSLAERYGRAAGYPTGAFTAYPVTGGASNWLVSQGIPAATVELKEHDQLEWGQNLAGVLAVLALYATDAEAEESGAQ